MYFEQKEIVGDYCAKSAFFDAQAAESWAADEYGEEELRKLASLFDETGSLWGKKILEPGCGTGRLTGILSQKVGKDGRVVALDISNAMVESAKKRLAQADNTTVLRAEVETFSFGKEKFDLVLCHQVFPHIENKELCLTRFKDLLVPNGRVILFHFIDFDEINNVHRKAGTVIHHDMMPDGVEMERLFKNAGFDIKFIRNNENGYFLMASR